MTLFPKENCSISQKMRWICGAWVSQGGRRRGSLPQFENLISAVCLCVRQAGRDESDHVDEAQAVLDAKASDFLCVCELMAAVTPRIHSDFATTRCDCRKFTKRARLDGAPTRSSSLRCCASGTGSICCEVAAQYSTRPNLKRKTFFTSLY